MEAGEPTRDFPAIETSCDYMSSVSTSLELITALPFLSANYATGGRTDCQSVLLSRTPALKNGRALITPAPKAVCRWVALLLAGRASDGCGNPSLARPANSAPSNCRKSPPAPPPLQEDFPLVTVAVRRAPAPNPCHSKTVAATPRDASSCVPISCGDCPAVAV